MGDDLAVVAAERRALIPGDERGGAVARLTIGAHLVDRHSHQGLHTGEEVLAVAFAVLGLEIGGLAASPLVHHVGHLVPP